MSHGFDPVNAMCVAEAVARTRCSRSSTAFAAIPNRLARASSAQMPLALRARRVLRAVADRLRSLRRKPYVSRHLVADDDAQEADDSVTEAPSRVGRGG